jgi:hypothetical protein
VAVRLARHDRGEQSRLVGSRSAGRGPDRLDMWFAYLVFVVVADILVQIGTGLLR